MERNINSLLGYSLDATEGEIGKVEEFYFDDDTWIVRYLILKTGNWLVGRKVLISPLALVKNFREDGAFRINLNREQIRAFIWHWAIENNNIRISVSGDGVRLNGTVKSVYQLAEAERLAWNTPRRS